MAKIIHTLESVEQAAERQHHEVRRLTDLLTRGRVPESDVDRAIEIYQALAAQAAELRSGRPMLPAQRALLGLPATIQPNAGKPQARRSASTPRGPESIAPEYRERWSKVENELIAAANRLKARQAAQELKELGERLKAAPVASAATAKADSAHHKQIQKRIEGEYRLMAYQWVKQFNRD